MSDPDVLYGYAESSSGYGVVWLELHKQDNDILVWENGNHRDDLELSQDDDSLLEFEKEYGAVYGSLKEYRYAISGGADPLDIETWWLGE